MRGNRASTGIAAETLTACAAGSAWLGAWFAGGRISLVAAALVTALLAAAAVAGRRARSRVALDRDEATGALIEIARELGVNPDERAARLGKNLAGRIAQARAEGRLLAAILDAVDDPVLAVDAEGLVTGANRAAGALARAGSPPPEIGTPLDLFLPDEHALEIVRRAIGGRPSRGQTRLLTEEWPRVLEIGAEPLNAPSAGGGAVVTLRDVTEQANAMQLKTDFVANASHELRTPLALIKTAAETLTDIGEGSPEIRSRLVSVIASNAERLEELTRDLLDLSSLESPEAVRTIELIDVHAAAAELREQFEGPCAERRLTLSFELDDRLRAVWTDGRLLRLVLRNLLDNAVKFAYEGTPVVVRGTVVDRGGRERADARFEVIDRGIGIPLAQQQRIFERFYQVDAARSGSARRRGTGLGLAIVKHAVRTMGGSVHVRSVWQQGTTMTVELPDCVEGRRINA